MKQNIRQRTTRPVRLPTVMLMLASIAGFASVGHAEEIAVTTVTTSGPLLCDDNPTIAQEMQSQTERAIHDTRVSVAIELHGRLHRQQRASFKLAGGDPAGLRG